MNPEKKSDVGQMNSAVEQDYRRIAVWLGVPVAMIAALVLTDRGLDKLEQTGLVRKTRDKAALIAKDPCEVKSFSPRHRFEFPSRRQVDYKCGKEEITCGPNPASGEYDCKKFTAADKARRILKEMQEMAEDLKKLEGK